MSQTTAPQTANREQIGKALGRIPSGLFIITAQHGDRKVGMLASWVQQVSFEPPTVMVCVHPERELYSLIQETGRFCVNVMGAGNKALFKPFSRYVPDQFDQTPHTPVEEGIILDDCVAALQCRLKQVVEAGDHHLALAEVVNGRMMHPENEPSTHTRADGFQY